MLASLCTAPLLLEERRVALRVSFAEVAWAFAVWYQYNSQYTGKIVFTTSRLLLACFQLAAGSA